MGHEEAWQQDCEQQHEGVSARVTSGVARRRPNPASANIKIHALALYGTAIHSNLSSAVPVGIKLIAALRLPIVDCRMTIEE
jgi:hypothetical protein